MEAEMLRKVAVSLSAQYFGRTADDRLFQWSFDGNVVWQPITCRPPYMNDSRISDRKASRIAVETSENARGLFMTLRNVVGSRFFTEGRCRTASRINYSRLRTALYLRSSTMRCPWGQSLVVRRHVEWRFALSARSVADL